MANKPSDAKPTPPYVPWKSFLGFLDALKGTAIPPRIDPSVMRQYSGSVQTQLRTAFRFLKLTDAGGVVQQKLRDLVAARGTDTWKAAIGGVITDAYADTVGDLDLDNATLQQLNERFRDGGAEGSVVVKAVRFYLSAMDEAGLTYSPHFSARGARATNGAPRPRPRAPRNPAARAASDGDGGSHEDRVPKGVRRFPLPLPGKPDAVVHVPEDLTESDWKMIDFYIRTYFGFGKTR